MPSEKGPPVNRDNEKPQIIKLEGFEDIKIVEPGSIGFTDFLGTCLGVIIYDPQSRYALMGKFLEAGKHLETLLAKAKKYYTDPTKVKVQVCGGSPLPPKASRDSEYDNRRRTKLIETLKRERFGSIDVDFASENEDMIMKIDTQTGKIEYGVEDFDY